MVVYAILIDRHVFYTSLNVNLFVSLFFEAGSHCVALDKPGLHQTICRPGWPRTRDLPVSAFQVLELKVCIHHHIQLTFHFEISVIKIFQQFRNTMKSPSVSAVMWSAVLIFSYSLSISSSLTVFSNMVASYMCTWLFYVQGF